MSVTLLTAAEVAEQLRVSTMTVYRLIRRGELPAVRVGRNYRVRARDLETYLDGPGRRPRQHRPRRPRGGRPRLTGGPAPRPWFARSAPRGRRRVGVWFTRPCHTADHRTTSEGVSTCLRAAAS
jgi:excisionase family DNA binding protein